MSQDTEFVNGLIVKAPNENAPEYVKGKLSIKNAELIAYLQDRISKGDEWTNVDIKVSQGGKWYAPRDTWKPQQGGASSARQPAREPRREAPPVNQFADDFADSDIPFASNRSVW